jgi:hypothetical protein
MGRHSIPVTDKCSAVAISLPNTLQTAIKDYIARENAKGNRLTLSGLIRSQLEAILNNEYVDKSIPEPPVRMPAPAIHPITPEPLAQAYNGGLPVGLDEAAWRALLSGRSVEEAPQRSVVDFIKAHVDPEAEARARAEEERRLADPDGWALEQATITERLEAAHEELNRRR